MLLLVIIVSSSTVEVVAGVVTGFASFVIVFAASLGPLMSFLTAENAAWRCWWKVHTCSFFSGDPSRQVELCQGYP